MIGFIFRKDKGIINFKRRKQWDRRNEGEKMSHIIKFLNLPFQVAEDFCLLKDKEKSYSYNTFMQKAVRTACLLEEKNISGKAVAIKVLYE